MRNSHNITITESDTFAADDETTGHYRGRGRFYRVVVGAGIPVSDVWP